MKNICLILLASFVSSQASAVNYNSKPCGIELEQMSASSGMPGDTFVLLGQWGDTQGEKLPRINKGRSNNLEVVSWSNTRIVVRIPENLTPGLY